MKKILMLFVSIFFMMGSNFYAQQSNDSIPEVKIAGTQLLKIHSSIVNQDYDLYINLPGNFDDNKSYPVIYLLDAQWDFTLLNSIYGQEYFDGFIPAAIVVGITWGGVNPNPDLLRSRDFTPTKTMQSPISGGAEKFLSFIKKELIPFIDSRFRTKPGERTLMGSSLGGLFTLYALFNETSLFNHYVLTSPAIGWDNGIINSYEKKYAEVGSEIPVRLSMAVGGYEDVNSFQKFADNLKEKHYKGLELKTFVLDGFGHSGGKAEGYSRGLQFAFKINPLTLSDNILDQYVGTYEINPQFKIKINKEEGHLVAEEPGGTKIIVNAESEIDFYATGMYLKVHFKKDKDGNVTGFQLEQYGGGQFVKKID